MAAELLSPRRSLGCFLGRSQCRYAILFARRFFHLLCKNPAQACVERAKPAAADQERGQLDARRRPRRCFGLSQFLSPHWTRWRPHAQPSSRTKFVQPSATLLLDLFLLYKSLIARNSP
jgi:hypothetical protein